MPPITPYHTMGFWPHVTLRVSCPLCGSGFRARGRDGPAACFCLRDAPPQDPGRKPRKNHPTLNPTAVCAYPGGLRRVPARAALAGFAGESGGRARFSRPLPSSRLAAHAERGKTWGEPEQHQRDKRLRPHPSRGALPSPPMVDSDRPSESSRQQAGSRHVSGRAEP